MDQTNLPTDNVNRAVNSISGDILEIAFSLPEDAFEDAEIRSSYRRILGSFSDYTRIWLCVGTDRRDAAQQLVDEIGISDRCNIVCPRDVGSDFKQDLAPWIQDAFFSATQASSPDTHASDRQRLLVPRHSPNTIANLMMLSADMICGAAQSFEKVTVEAAFQGGNIIVTDRGTLVGGDEIATNIRQFSQQATDLPFARQAQLVGNLLSERLGLVEPVRFVTANSLPPEREIESTSTPDSKRLFIQHTGRDPNGVQPAFHLDMFLSPAGKNAEGLERMLVGDPRPACEATGFRPRGYEDWCASLDEIAASLKEWGYEVHRNPLAFAFKDKPAQPGTAISASRTWYLASSNNVVAQWGGTDNIVWMPTYGHGEWQDLAITDAENSRIWQELGFEVRDLGNFHPFAEKRGAIHCISNVLRRGEIPTGSRAGLSG